MLCYVRPPKFNNIHHATRATSSFRVLKAQKNRYPFIYQRSADNQRFVIAVNPSEHKVEAQIDGDHPLCQVVYSNSTGVEINRTLDDNTTILLPPESFVVFN